MKYIYSAKPRRVFFLDELRGLCILLMVAYHAAYDLVYIFHVDIPAFHWPLLRFAQPFVAGIFIFVSGIACRYSRNNIKRGLIALMLGVAMSAVTILYMPEQAIYFGILHFLGVSMLLFAMLEHALDLLPPFWGFLLFGALFAFFYSLPDGFLGFPGFTINLPEALYTKHYLLPFGFGGMGADYFPLLPWLFLFFAGGYFGLFSRENALPSWFYRKHVPALATIGRYTIYIYVLHQPVVYVILLGIFRVLEKV